MSLRGSSSVQFVLLASLFGDSVTLGVLGTSLEGRLESRVRLLIGRSSELERLLDGPSVSLAEFTEGHDLDILSTLEVDFPGGVVAGLVSSVDPVGVLLLISDTITLGVLGASRLSLVKSLVGLLIGVSGQSNSVNGGPVVGLVEFVLAALDVGNLSRGGGDGGSGVLLVVGNDLVNNQ